MNRGRGPESAANRGGSTDRSQELPQKDVEILHEVARVLQEEVVVSSTESGHIVSAQLRTSAGRDP